MKKIINLEEIPGNFIKIIGSQYSLSYPRQGHTSEVVIVVGSQKSFVIKRASDKWFKNMLRNEIDVLNRLLNSKVKAPRIFEIYGDKNYLWVLMEYIKGDTLRSVFEKNDNKLKSKMLINYGKMLKVIHSEIYLSESNNESWIDKKLREAEYNLYHYKVDGTSQLLEYLKANKPSYISETFIHGDYTIDNVLFDNGEVAGVIDWSNGGLGDPRYDIALAIRPKKNLFQTVDDINLFFEGYGEKKIKKDEFDYFQSGGLYDFF